MFARSFLHNKTQEMCVSIGGLGSVSESVRLVKPLFACVTVFGASPSALMVGWENTSVWLIASNVLENKPAFAPKDEWKNVEIFKWIRRSFVSARCVSCSASSDPTLHQSFSWISPVVAERQEKCVGWRERKKNRSSQQCPWNPVINYVKKHNEAKESYRLQLATQFSVSSTQLFVKEPPHCEAN